MIGNIGKKSHKSQQTIKSLKGIERNFQWMCWEQMKTLFGEEKAQKKIHSGKLEDRPDPDTGLNDFNSKEWKIYFDTGGDKELDEHSRKLTIDEVLEPGEAQEMLSNFKDFQGKMAGNDSPTQVKIEPAGEKEKEGKVDKESKEEIEPEDEDMGEDEDEDESFNFMCLWETPKVVLRNVRESSTTLKEMLEATAPPTKYCNELHDDIKNLLPKFGKLAKAVEAVVVSPYNEEYLRQLQTEGTAAVDRQRAALKALAMKLDAHFEEFENVKAAYYKFFPKTPKVKKAMRP